MKKNKNILGKNIETFLGKYTEFEGDLKFFGAIRVDGFVKGNILGEGTLYIGEGSKIESDIHVTNIVNYGEIHGNIIAEKKIDIRMPGKVFGNIEAPVIEIETGAIFQGGENFFHCTPTSPTD